MLANDPTFLFGTSGNALSNTLLNHYPTAPSSVSFVADFSTVIGGMVDIWSIGAGSVNATNGCLVQIFPTVDNTWFSTVSYVGPFLFPTIASTTQRQPYWLDNGKYTISLLNTDPLNNINVMASTGLLT